MVPKKVGTITLEHDRGDGVMVSEAYDAEFQNAVIGGDISFMEGTFQGKLTAQAINAVNNLNIRGKSAAVTYVTNLAEANSLTHGFDDDGVYRNVHQIAVEVPVGYNGVWVAVSMSYQIADEREDNDQFPCRSRILVDDSVYWQSSLSYFGNYYRHFTHHAHEVVAYLSGSGFHTISLQWMWASRTTNVYPVFRNIRFRADVVKK